MSHSTVRKLEELYPSTPVVKDAQNNWVVKSGWRSPHLWDTSDEEDNGYDTENMYSGPDCDDSDANDTGDDSEDIEVHELPVSPKAVAPDAVYVALYGEPPVKKRKIDAQVDTPPVDMERLFSLATDDISSEWQLHVIRDTLRSQDIPRTWVIRDHVIWLVFDKSDYTRHQLSHYLCNDMCHTNEWLYIDSYVDHSSWPMKDVLKGLKEKWSAHGILIDLSHVKRIAFEHYSCIAGMLGGYPVNNCESGFRRPHMVVFANSPPTEGAMTLVTVDVRYIENDGGWSRYPTELHDPSVAEVLRTLRRDEDVLGELDVSLSSLY